MRLFFTIVLCLSFNICNATETLIVEPDAGRAPLLNAVGAAKSSIHLVMYGLTDEAFINALVAKKRSKLNVDVLLEPSPYKAEGENQSAIKQLKDAKIDFHYPNFKLLHQKTFLIDDKTAIVMTFNLTHSTFKNERNFALIIDDPTMVREISKVFTADWQQKKFHVTHPDLIWSPDDSRDKIINFIKSADNTIDVYAQALSDYQVIGELAKAARNGVKIRVLLSSFNKGRNRKLEFLKKAGVKIHINKKMIIHAKVIIVDNKKALLGSINLTRSSINLNRELAIITHNTTTIQKLSQTFQMDWGKDRARAHDRSRDFFELLIKEVHQITKDMKRAYKL